MRYLREFSNTKDNKASVYGAVILFTFLSICTYCLAEEQILTVDNVVERLSSSEAAFNDLRLEYVSHWREPNQKDGSHNNIDSNVFMRIEATYAQKRPGLRYLEKKYYRINTDTGEITVYADDIVSYDGNATYILDKNIRPGKTKRGSVRPGYEPNWFSGLYIDPYTNIWTFGSGKKSLASKIRENKGTFRIEQGIESLEGVPTIKLVGTISSGLITKKVWVSPERDFLPLKSQTFRGDNGRLLSDMVLSDLVQLPNGLWFPKSICIGSLDPEWAWYQEITKISVDSIPVGFFALEFPKGTEVVDDILGIRYEK
jgi:hypothetical protein